MKVSVYIATSLDGFIARANGDLDWLPGSDGESAATASGEDYGYHDFMASVDVLVMGRHTFEKVLSFGQWPYGDKRVVVLTNSLSNPGEGLPATVEFASGSPTKIYEELRSAGVEHVYLDGGKTIQAFLDAGLIDELILTRIPVLIGSGIPLFGPLGSDRKLRHIRSEAYANGIVQCHYAVL